MKWRILAVPALFFALGATANAEPGWSSDVVVTGPTRQRIQSTPIVHRPYRPFHIYGNTIRRLHYRGSAVPTRQDVQRGWRVLTRRPYVPVVRYLR